MTSRYLGAEVEHGLGVYGAAGSVETGDTDMAEKGEGDEANGFVPAPLPVNVDDVEAGVDVEAGAPGAPAKCKAPVPAKGKKKKNLEETVEVEEVRKILDYFDDAVDNTNKNKTYGPLNEDHKRTACHMLAVLATQGEISHEVMRVISLTWNGWRSNEETKFPDLREKVAMPKLRRLFEKTIGLSQARAAGPDKPEAEGGASGAKTKRKAEASNDSAPKRAAVSNDAQPNTTSFHPDSTEQDLKAKIYSQLIGDVLMNIYKGVRKHDPSTTILGNITTAIDQLQIGLIKEYQDTTKRQYEGGTRSLEEFVLRLMRPSLFFANIADKAKQVANGTIPKGKRHIAALHMSPAGGLRIQDMQDIATKLHFLEKKNPNDVDLKKVVFLFRVTAWHVGQKGIVGRFFTMPLQADKMLKPKMNTRTLLQNDPPRATEHLSSLVAAFGLDVSDADIKSLAARWVDIGNLMQWCRCFILDKDMEEAGMTPATYEEKYSVDTALSALDIPQEAPFLALRVDGADAEGAAGAAAEAAPEAAAEAAPEAAAEGAAGATPEAAPEAAAEGDHTRTSRRRRTGGILVPEGELRRSERKKKSIAFTEVNCTAEALQQEQDLTGFEVDVDMQDANDGGADSASGQMND